MLRFRKWVAYWLMVLYWSGWSTRLERWFTYSVWGLMILIGLRLLLKVLGYTVVPVPHE